MGFQGTPAETVLHCYVQTAQEMLDRDKIKHIIVSIDGTVIDTKAEHAKGTILLEVVNNKVVGAKEA